MTENIIATGEAFDGIILSDKEKEDLLRLGGLRWEENKIAAYFGWDKKALHHALENPESEISRLLLRGELESDFKIEAKLMTDAQSGNLAAARQFSELLRDRSFKLSKLDIFGGAEDRSLYDVVQRYIDKGCPGDLSTREQLYIDMLQMVYSMSVKLGDRATVRLLSRAPYNLSYDRARDLIAEAVELFNGGRRCSKEAMRYHTAETYDNLYHMIMKVAKTPQDIALAAQMLEKKVKLLQLNEPDVPVLPPEQYLKTYRVLSLTPETLGLPAANRDELASQIDALDIPDGEKRRVRMEAGVVDMDIVEMLENVVSEESK